MTTQAQPADLLKSLGALATIGPDIERLGSLQAVEQDLKTRIDRLKRDEAELLGSFKTRARSEVGEEWVHEARARAEVQAKEIIATANKHAEQIKMQTAGAQQRLAQLNDELQKTERKWQQVIAALRATG